MDCEKVELLMVDYVEGELSLEMNRVIESHVDGCSHCRKAFSETKDILEKVRDVSSNISVNPSHKEALREGLLKELRIHRATSPFLSGLHRKKEEMKKRFMERNRERRAGEN